MTVLIDVVNVNADASCLDSTRWLTALKGEADSQFCNWLGLYIEYDKKMVLGLTGATVADLHAHNPHALHLIKEHPHIFEPVVRPFAHDIALMRQCHGFRRNLELGMRAIKREFGRLMPFFLPPEFMLSNEQIAALADKGINAVFVNPARLSHDVRERLPSVPYNLRGVRNTTLGCLPVNGDATQCYLDALHSFDSSKWNAFVANVGHSVLITWRDGESVFLIPDGIEREACWLAGEHSNRKFLADVEFRYQSNELLDPHLLRAYPVHSFQAWMKEFRMMGYLARLQYLENDVVTFSVTEQVLWLLAIGSDVLSSVEKKSPVVKLSTSHDRLDEVNFTIFRSERGFEGEEYLYALEQLRRGEKAATETLMNSDESYAVKFRGRLHYLHEIA